MKSIFVITFLLFLITKEGMAQRQWIGIAAGANRTNITSSNFLNTTNAVWGVSGGITYEHFFDERISLGADALYIKRGFATKLLDSLGNDEPASRYDYEYISVPLRVGFSSFNARDNIIGFIKIGVVPSLLINAETEVPAFEAGRDTVDAQRTNTTESVSSFDLAGLVELGGGSKIMNNLWLTIAFTYQHSITSISNTNYFSSSEIRHRAMGGYIGLKMTL